MGMNATGTGSGTPTSTSPVATFTGAASGLEVGALNGVGMLWLAVLGAGVGAMLLS